MFTSTVKNLPKNELLITITISSDEIKMTREKVLDEVVKNAELKGFRKGKVPRDLVEKDIDKDKLYQETFQELLPRAYSEALTKNDLHPIVDPEIKLISPSKLSEIDEGKEVIFEAKTAVKPVVNLKDYKDKIKSLNAKAAIWTPDKGKPDEKTEVKKPAIEEIIKILLDTVNVELPDILVNHESQRFLSQTLDEIKKLGLTLDQYLASTGKSADLLKAEASQKALGDLKLEFALGEIAKQEKITVEQKDIDKVINENKDPQAQENLRKQSYLIATVLLQQKTLDFLKAL